MEKDVCMTVLETFASDSMRRKELLHHPHPQHTHTKDFQVLTEKVN